MAVAAGISFPAVAASAAPADALSTAQQSVATYGAAAVKSTTAETGASVITKTPAKSATTAKAKAKQSKKAAAPTAKQLHPRGVPTRNQESFKPSNEQLRNAREIVKAGQKMGLSPRGQVIGVATAMQESTLRNLGNLGERNDHDSQGLFQQRPSSGWGTPKQITNPQYAATSFFKGLVSVDGWERMPLTDAAQAVQVSAFPDHYAKWEKQAGELVLAFYGEGPYAKQAAALK